MTNWDPEAFENAIVEDMRAHGGAVTSGPVSGHPLLLMTARGAKSGESRRKILTYTRDNGDYIVAGTASGSPKVPGWIFNVRANPDVEIEVENQKLRARATVVDDAERERLWQQHVVQLPWFADYPRQTGRVIPMVRLTPDPAAT